MFLPIVLDFENNGLKFMLLKYLRFFDLCRRNNWAIITHEEFEKYEINFPNRNEYKENMIKLYGYSLYSVEERQEVKQYFVKKEFYEKLHKEYGSELECALHLLNDSNEELKGIITNVIQDLRSQGENIEGILYFAACPVSVKEVASEYNIPLVAYETGPIRSPNYRCTTSYFCNEGLYNTGEIRQRFENFKEVMTELPTFSREEILTMFLNYENLGYVSLIDKTPKYEIGIAGGCALVVPYFAITKYMDHELIDDVLDIYNPKDIFVRLHPGDMYKATYRLPYYDVTPTPFPFLINSKRVAAVGSNLLFEAMLWKRIPCSMANVMPSNIMCNQDYISVKEKDDVEEFVNFFVFSFLVPFDLAYEEEYLRWRLSNPSEKEIYMFHLEYYMKKFGLTEEWLKQDSATRLTLLKLYRDFMPFSEEELKEKTIIANTALPPCGESKEASKEHVQVVQSQELLRQYTETKAYLDNVLNSTSWKITYPLRKLLDILKGRK